MLKFLEKYIKLLEAATRVVRKISKKTFLTEHLWATASKLCAKMLFPVDEIVNLQCFCETFRKKRLPTVI